MVPVERQLLVWHNIPSFNDASVGWPENLSREFYVLGKTAILTDADDFIIVANMRLANLTLEAGATDNM